MNNRSIYIVLSQTGTVFSRILKLFTRAEYNHASISLNSTLENMYSFGRVNPYNPFVGGFVEEGKNLGTFKRFKNTKALVLQIKVSEETYNNLNYYINYFIKHKPEFHYNYLGVLMACFKKNVAPQNRFYCSQFVRTCLSRFNVDNSKDLPKIIKPIDFLKLNNKNIVYIGFLKNYSAKIWQNITGMLV